MVWIKLWNPILCIQLYTQNPAYLAHGRMTILYTQLILTLNNSEVVRPLHYEIVLREHF